MVAAAPGKARRIGDSEGNYTIHKALCQYTILFLSYSRLEVEGPRT
jgi:hypothetical protein